VDAVSPDGAMVDYVATATGSGGGPVPVTCAPPSGSTFAIGTTTVLCSATDATGTSNGSFTVHVRGVAEQLIDLMADSESVGPGKSLTSKVSEIEASLAAGDVRDACNGLTHAYPNAVAAQAGKKITVEDADRLIADAMQIANVLGCTEEAPPPVSFAMLLPLGLLGLVSGRRLLASRPTTRPF
jgi:hypothetical protein